MRRRNGWIAAILCCGMLLIDCGPKPDAPGSGAEPDHTPPAYASVDEDVSFDRFPDYDTGTDADWSYQSDTLRIAIRRYQNPERRQIYYVADVWLRSLRSFRAGFANGAYDSGTEDAESFSARENAVLAINGNYNMGLVVHDGKLYRPLDDRHEAVMALYRDGSMQALSREAFDTDAALKDGLVHAWQFGPLLVHEGKPGDTDAASGFGIRHSRIMLGYYEPGHYVAVAVDGRRKGAIGMDANDMIELMLSLGCREAINLDGGTSAIMTFMGKTVNDPPRVTSDESVPGGRRLADMIIFTEYSADGIAPALDTLEANVSRENDRTERKNGQ